MAQAIRDEIIEELLQGYSSPTDLLGEEGLFKELKKRLLERALGAELSEHLGYERGDPAGRSSGNSRNGYSSKTVIGDDGAIDRAHDVLLGLWGQVELSRRRLTARGSKRCPRMLSGFFKQANLLERGNLAAK